MHKGGHAFACRLYGGACAICCDSYLIIVRRGNQWLQGLIEVSGPIV